MSRITFKNFIDSALHWQIAGVKGSGGNRTIAQAAQHSPFRLGVVTLTLQLFLVYALAASYAGYSETRPIFSVALTTVGIRRNISIPVATSAIINMRRTRILDLSEAGTVVLLSPRLAYACYLSANCLTGIQTSVSTLGRETGCSNYFPTCSDCAETRTLTYPGGLTYIPCCVMSSARMDSATFHVSRSRVCFPDFG